MKTKLRFFKSVKFILLLVSILLFSCAKEEQIIAPEPGFEPALTLKNGSINLPPEEIACDLIAGQTINVGTVVYSHDLTNLYVTYVVNSPWVMTEMHFYAGNFAGLPVNKTAIQVGHFPYDMGDLSGNQLTIPLSSLSSDGGVLTLAAHAVVVNGTQNETAWANCTYKPLIASKSFFNDMPPRESSATYAMTDGSISYKDHFTIINSSLWCNWLGFNVYQNGDVYNLQSKYYGPTALEGKLISNEYAGKVIVSDDGDILSVEIISQVTNFGYNHMLDASHLFVGSWNQLKALIPTGGCPDYANFPYFMDIESESHVFDIPIPIKSVSFSSAFGSNRWGWISKYAL